jgi:hypothetical protein
MVEFSTLAEKMKALELNKTLFKNKIAIIQTRKGKSSNYIIRKSNKKIKVIYLYMKLFEINNFLNR